MPHRRTFLQGCRILNRQLFCEMKSLPSSKTVLMGLYNGLLESAHAVTICRAVCYFLPCDLHLSEGKKMKVPLEQGKKNYLVLVILHFLRAFLERLGYEFSYLTNHTIILLSSQLAMCLTFSEYSTLCGGRLLCLNLWLVFILYYLEDIPKKGSSFKKPQDSTDSS